MKKIYKVEVDCANCANKIEEAIQKLDGIKQCHLSFMTMKLKVEFEEHANIDDVMNEAYKVCKKIEPDCEIYL